MKPRDLCKYALLVLGAVGTLLPASLVTAAEDAAVIAKSANRSTVKPQNKVATRINDVSLGANGELTGFVIDEQGKAIGHSRVVVRLGRKVIAETKTDAVGKFQIEGLRGGVYQIIHAEGVSIFRVWKAGTAPRNAKRNALLISMKRQIVRGQDGFGPLSMIQPATLASGAAAITGITLGVIGISEANDANDEAAAANAKVDALIATLN